VGIIATKKFEKDVSVHRYGYGCGGTAKPRP
jgi:hypothetical protein